MQQLIGQEAPDFTAKAVIDGEKLVDQFSLRDFRGKYLFFFFYPLDFTFVCPTELHAFQEREAEFAARNTQIVGCSVDSVYSHYAWLKTPKNRGGIEGVRYPLIADFNKEIAKCFNVLKADDGIAYRGQFIIDKNGIIRHQLVNDLPIGRSVDEVLRLLDAIIFHEEHGEVCPANWHVGAKSMQPNAEGLVRYFEVR
jgi:peroxiredoxin (alkyl hydroperoxide reductase subunit C)